MQTLATPPPLPRRKGEKKAKQKKRRQKRGADYPNFLNSFCICNEGFAVERLLHGMKESYNDIASWKHKGIITALGGDEHLAKCFQIRAMADLDELLLDEEFNNRQGLQFVELYMDKIDAPRSFLSTAQALRKGSSNA